MRASECFLINMRRYFMILGGNLPFEPLTSMRAWKQILSAMHHTYMLGEISFELESHTAIGTFECTVFYVHDRI